MIKSDLKDQIVEETKKLILSCTQHNYISNLKSHCFSTKIILLQKNKKFQFGSTDQIVEETY